MRKYILLLTLLSGFVSAEPVHVFFAGGQSNAKSEWAAGIERTLTESGLYGRVVVVHQNHRGAPLYRWSVAADLYPVDFFAADGTGLLQSRMQAIRDAGDTPIFEGLFWFQGEADAMTMRSISLYPIRLARLLRKLENDLGVTPRYCLSVIGANTALPPPAGRTWQEINAMRNMQFGLGSLDQNGVAFDTMHFERTDSLHLTPEELDRAGIGMASLFMATHYSAPAPPVTP